MWEVTVFKGNEVMVIGIEPKGHFQEFAEMSIEFWKEHGADSVVVKNKKGEEAE